MNAAFLHKFIGSHCMKKTASLAMFISFKNEYQFANLGGCIDTLEERGYNTNINSARLNSAEVKGTSQ